MLCDDTLGSYEVAAKLPLVEDMDEKWPEDVEEAFLEAVEYLKSVGRRKFSINGKLCGRNELISRYVFKKTQKYRSRKQVSSHIQVWKNSKKPPCRGGKGGPMDKVKFTYFQKLLQENHSASSERRSLPNSPCQSSAIPSTDRAICVGYPDVTGPLEHTEPLLMGNEWNVFMQSYPAALVTPASSVTGGLSTPSSPITTVSTNDGQDKMVVWPNYFGLCQETDVCGLGSGIQQTIAKIREIHATQYPSLPFTSLFPHTLATLGELISCQPCPVALMRIGLDLNRINHSNISDACIVESSDSRPLQCSTHIISCGRQLMARSEAKVAAQVNGQHVYHFDFVSQFIGTYLHNTRNLPNPQAVNLSLSTLFVYQVFSELMSDQPLMIALYEFSVGSGIVEPYWVSTQVPSAVVLGNV
ncbi:hypothetical protein IWQ62_001288 [Dispira parvispora]|uniref:TEA domain-containing protein n=1 Tax=Dispira parvispora TaxID=1520584 RepID=A0A9W8AWG6_9FUNG|nr:hypothetical protein IWQ62_001288 [Dispira parvispora]